LKYLLNNFFEKENTMKTLIVSLLVVLTAGFANAEDDQQDQQPLLSVEEAQRIQRAGAANGLNGINLNDDDESDSFRLRPRPSDQVYGPPSPSSSTRDDFNEYEFDRQQRLRADCLQRRRDVENADSIPLVGNYASDFVIQGHRNVDGGTVVRRNDGTSVYLQNDRCAGINPPEREETDERGCKWRVRGSTRRLIGGVTCRR
jgi:hypothetical protein